MRLTPLDPSFAESFRRYVDDFRRAGEASRVAKYAAGAEDFPAYLRFLRLAAAGVDLPEDTVPYHTYWVIDVGQIVGTVRIRPRLTPKAERNDGHIGYDVAPSCRRKGYGTALLRLALAESRRLGLPDRVIVTCAADNTPSRRVIEKCGGRLLCEATDEDDGHALLRYELIT
jgi:predicted acetyltransferase